MLFNKFSYIDDIFEKDDLWWGFQLSAFYSASRIISMILNCRSIDKLLQLFHENVPLTEKSKFITEHYFIFNKRKDFNWNGSQKIKLFRTLKKQLFSKAN